MPMRNTRRARDEIFASGAYFEFTGTLPMVRKVSPRSSVASMELYREQYNVLPEKNRGLTPRTFLICLAFIRSLHEPCIIQRFAGKTSYGARFL
jgi:hypothetical protein